MDYCVIAACEGLICFIDFSLGRLPESAASHLSPRLPAVIDSNSLRQISQFCVKIETQSPETRREKLAPRAGLKSVHILKRKGQFDWDGYKPQWVAWTGAQHLEYPLRLRVPGHSQHWSKDKRVPELVQNAFSSPTLCRGEEGQGSFSSL